MKRIAQWWGLHGPDAQGFLVILLFVAILFGGASLLVARKYRSIQHVAYRDGVLTEVLPSSSREGYSAQSQTWGVAVRLASGREVEVRTQRLPRLGAELCLREYLDGLGHQQFAIIDWQPCPAEQAPGPTWDNP